ncbi:MAG: hypothetical protein K2P09_09105 [Erysipelotrichales bacterium]|nr:hypothetical protein [Erysipelotrichales bacterium]
MIYQIDSVKKEVDFNAVSKEHMYIGMMNLKELKECYYQFHISLQSIKHCEETSTIHQNVIIPHKNYYYGLINLINARDVFVKKDAMAFFIFQNLFLIVIIDDEDQHIEDIFSSSSNYVLDEGMSITRIVYCFFSELISRDYQYIEELQEEVEDLENDDEKEALMFTKTFKKLNKELLLLRNYYDHLISISEELQMNHHNIFIQDEMRYFEIFTHRLERISDNIQMLRDLLNQVYAVHQSKLDYQLNKTMQFFTVVTTIFMPLTLITGWYGMNFRNMPEIDFQYSYYIVIGISMIIVWGLIFLFKRKKFF